MGKEKNHEIYPAQVTTAIKKRANSLQKWRITEKKEVSVMTSTDRRSEPSTSVDAQNHQELSAQRLSHIAWMEILHTVIYTNTLCGEIGVCLDKSHGQSIKK